MAAAQRNAPSLRDLDTPVDSDDDTSRAVLRLRPGSGVVRRGLTLGLTLDF